MPTLQTWRRGIVPEYPVPLPGKLSVHSGDVPLSC